MELTEKIYKGENFLFFNIWVTLDCNYQCTYCYEAGKKIHRHMEIKDANQVTRFIIEMCDFKEIRTVWLNFHGGEPLLNEKTIKHIIDKMRSFSNIRIYTSLTTNCSIYSSEISKYINELTVSIDGIRETHDRNRKSKTGEGTYETSINNAMRYLADKGEVRLRMVVTSNNVSQLFQNVKHLYELGFKMIIPGVDYYDKGWNEDLFEELYQQLVRIREYRDVQKKDDFMVGILDEKIKEKGKCIVGCDGYQVSVEGDLYPCILVVEQREYCIGNIYDGINIENTKRLNLLFRNEVDACSDCTNYKYCISRRCLLLNKQLTNDYFTPSAIVCALERVKLRLQGLV